MNIISVIMPVYNGETTVEKTLKSLFLQTKKFDELIVVDDASSDRSKEIVQEYLEGKRECQLIEHKKNKGLAESYNDAISLSKGNLIITLHQDVVLNPDALEKLLKPFGDEKVAAAGHWSIFPRGIWKKFSFWQKCFFSRFVGKEISGINGQFDCFRKEALEKAGFFDGKKFRTAGEDADMVWKLSKLGRIVQSGAKLVHIQKAGSDFGPKDIIWKQKQHSEARGALLALGRTKGFLETAKTFFREILVLMLFVPFLNFISLIIIVIYSFAYTGSVFVEEYTNPRIFLLPIFNIYLLFLGVIYSLKGFIYGKQRL
jgi:GT2 family glycosyltransferase